MIEAYAAHLRQRYGAQADTWLWEVWNEPDIGYWHGTPDEFMKLYDYAARGRPIVSRSSTVYPKLKRKPFPTRVGASASGAPSRRARHRP